MTSALVVVNLDRVTEQRFPMRALAIFKMIDDHASAVVRMTVSSAKIDFCKASTERNGHEDHINVLISKLAALNATKIKIVGFSHASLIDEMIGGLQAAGFRKISVIGNPLREMRIPVQLDVTSPSSLNFAY